MRPRTRFLLMAIVFLLAVLAFAARAENWMRTVDVEEGLVRGFELRSSCEAGGFACLELGDSKSDEVVLQDLGDGNFTLALDAAKREERMEAEAEVAARTARRLELATKKELSSAEVQEALQLLLSEP